VLLVDTPPELRLALLAAAITTVDAVFISHLHADHIHGIDDLRIFSLRAHRRLPLYVADEHAAELRARFPYIFDESLPPSPETGAPEIDLGIFHAGVEISIAGFRLTPLAFPHGSLNSYGFRAGGLGVIVDGKSVPPDALRALQGVDVLVINALWWERPHPGHFNVEEALDAAREIGARRTFLTHLTHRLDYEELRRRLPSDVRPAYDGLAVDI
jgi:phosphoribosyl 1,2-cyclic phosphate phosphodiesterase